MLYHYSWDVYTCRYVREWLGCMAAANIVNFDPTDEKFWLPAHRSNIMDLKALAMTSPILCRGFFQVADCFRKGGPAGEETCCCVLSYTTRLIYYWNKVTVHHLKLCVVVVKLASTPMMDTHDTEFVNWLLTPHLFKDVSRSLVSKHTDFEIILLTVKQWFNRTPQIIVLSFFIKK